MTESGKKILQYIAYYGMILTMLAYIVFFIFGLQSDRVSNWARICYIIICGLLVGLVVFDLICNYMGNYKFISGLILVAITIFTIAMSFAVYGAVAVRGAIPAGLLDIFYLQIAMSYGINILTIVIYCVGGMMRNRKLTNKIGK